nr:MAG TPA: serine/threonine-protein kinase [Inoviridae sp.]
MHFTFLSFNYYHKSLKEFRGFPISIFFQQKP